MLSTTNPLTCHCKAWQANLPKLEQLVIANWNRRGSGYTGDPSELNVSADENAAWVAAYVLWSSV